MKFAKYLFFCFVFLHSFSNEAQNLLIRVFSQKKIQSIELEVIQGSYQVHSAEGFLLEINDGQSLKLQVNSLNQIHVAKNGDFIGVYDTLSLFQSSHFDYIRLYFTHISTTFDDIRYVLWLTFASNRLPWMAI